jgi:HEAT repeat protein
VKSRHAAERHAAAEALLLLGERSGLAPLEADLADARVWVRLGAVKAVASVVDSAPDGSSEGPRVPFPDRVARGAARLLISALEDSSVTVRRTAARALEDLVGEDFGYAPRSPAEHRARALRRWRVWLEALPSTGAE